MPDISMCQNRTCPLRGACYRYLAIPDAAMQSYSGFDWDYVTGCRHFVAIADSDRLQSIADADLANGGRK